jgi:hypothetical protein
MAQFSTRRTFQRSVHRVYTLRLIPCHASARAASDPRLAWISAGVSIAFAAAGGRRRGARALPDSDDEAIPTERCFIDAHAVGLGVALELSVIALALGCQERLPDGATSRSTSPPPYSSTRGLIEELERRALGIRVAVDDVGSGFSSFRHATRVNPDILKLDRTLVCGIDDDPVRQSLASAIDTDLPDLTVVG